MRTCVRVALFAVFIIILAAPACAQPVLVHGTLAGDPMPEGYKYELSVVAVRAEQGIVFEVVGKSCSLAASPLSCQRTTIVFAPPAGSLSVVNKKAFYKHAGKQVHIGDVAGLGNTHWVNLKRGAVLEATTTAARVKLDLGILGTGTLSQESRFVLLHAAVR